MTQRLPPHSNNPLLVPFRIVIGLLLLVDAIARPFYRPLRRWIASLGIVEAAERKIAELPRLAILVLLLVPFVCAEPLKFVAFVRIAHGGVVSGLILLAFAYLVSFVLVERIYSAGKPKLLTYGWLAWTMGQVASVKEYMNALKADIVTGVKSWLKRIGIG